MEILLEEFYKTDISIDNYHQRKLEIDDKYSYQIIGITQSGKTKFIKNYLSLQRKGEYLYVDCNDLRIDIDELNLSLANFCIKHKILVLALDNYNSSIKIPNVKQLIISSQIKHNFSFLKTVILYPLDYEEFLAYEHRFDSSTLNNYISMGGFAKMHKLSVDERVQYIQNLLRCNLDSIELNILIQCSKMMCQKISAFSIYERLRGNIKISKDRLYKSFEDLEHKNYIHTLKKIAHPKATKKIYICDISLRYALSSAKNFSKIFENLIFLELLKSDTPCYYDDGVDFYIPSKNEIIMAAPFANERAIFKKIETIESFIITYNIKKIIVISMSNESSINHPFAKVDIIPFDIWALGE